MTHWSPATVRAFSVIFPLALLYTTAHPIGSSHHLLNDAIVADPGASMGMNASLMAPYAHASGPDNISSCSLHDTLPQASPSGIDDASAVVADFADIIGTAAFAICGALICIARQFDLFGVLLLSAVTALGGGICRDVILGRTPPANFYNYRNLSIAFGSALLVFLFVRRFREQYLRRRLLIDMVVNFCDAIGIGSFCTFGAQLALDRGHGDNVFFCTFCGMLTCVGGGMLRDALSGYTSGVFRTEIYASLCAAASLVYYYLRLLVGQGAAALVILPLVVLIRMLSIVYKWQLPTIALEDGSTAVPAAVSVEMANELHSIKAQLAAHANVLAPMLGEGSDGAGAHGLAHDGRARGMARPLVGVEHPNSSGAGSGEDYPDTYGDADAEERGLYRVDLGSRSDAGVGEGGAAELELVSMARTAARTQEPSVPAHMRTPAQVVRAHDLGAHALYGGSGSNNTGLGSVSARGDPVLTRQTRSHSLTHGHSHALGHGLGLTLGTVSAGSRSRSRSGRSRHSHASVDAEARSLGGSPPLRTVRLAAAHAAPARGPAPTSGAAALAVGSCGQSELDCRFATIAMGESVSARSCSHVAPQGERDSAAVLEEGGNARFRSVFPLEGAAHAPQAHGSTHALPVDTTPFDADPLPLPLPLPLSFSLPELDPFRAAAAEHADDIPVEVLTVVQTTPALAPTAAAADTAIFSPHAAGRPLSVCVAAQEDDAEETTTPLHSTHRRGRTGSVVSNATPAFSGAAVPMFASPPTLRPPARHGPPSRRGTPMLRPTHTPTQVHVQPQPSQPPLVDLLPAPTARMASRDAAYTHTPHTTTTSAHAVFLAHDTPSAGDATPRVRPADSHTPLTAPMLSHTPTLAAVGVPSLLAPTLTTAPSSRNAYAHAHALAHGGGSGVGNLTPSVHPLVLPPPPTFADLQAPAEDSLSPFSPVSTSTPLLAPHLRAHIRTRTPTMAPRALLPTTSVSSSSIVAKPLTPSATAHTHTHAHAHGQSSLGMSIGTPSVSASLPSDFLPPPALLPPSPLSSLSDSSPCAPVPLTLSPAAPVSPATSPAPVPVASAADTLPLLPPSAIPASSSLASRASSAEPALSFVTPLLPALSSSPPHSAALVVAAPSQLALSAPDAVIPISAATAGDHTVPSLRASSPLSPLVCTTAATGPLTAGPSPEETALPRPSSSLCLSLLASRHEGVPDLPSLARGARSLSHGPISDADTDAPLSHTTTCDASSLPIHLAASGTTGEAIRAAAALDALEATVCVLQGCRQTHGADAVHEPSSMPYPVDEDVMARHSCIATTDSVNVLCGVDAGLSACDMSFSAAASPAPMDELENHHPNAHVPGPVTSALASTSTPIPAAAADAALHAAAQVDLQHGAVLAALIADCCDAGAPTDASVPPPTLAPASMPMPMPTLTVAAVSPHAGSAPHVATVTGASAIVRCVSFTDLAAMATAPVSLYVSDNEEQP